MALRNQFRKASRFVVLAALLLSGCFRPAGDSIAPTSNATTDPNVQPLTAATPTVGAPPITLLSPDTSGATATSPAPALTEVTVIPFEPSATASPVSGTVTATLQIITPGSALDIVTPETATPLPTDIPIADLGTLAASTDEAVNISTEALVSGAPCTYTVEPGDSLYRIAILNDTNVAAMMDANPDLVGDAPILQPGQVLALPDCTPGEQPTTVPQDQIVESVETPLPANTELYTVRPGDTLYAIAIRFRTTVNAILEANNLANPNSLSIGQQLVIPNQEGSDQ